MYDIVIIGAGAGGLSAAYTASGLGQKVLLVEKNKIGGECTWSGCIPSKALIDLAKTFQNKKKIVETEINTDEVLEKVRSIREKVYQGETPEVLKSHGIECLFGKAKFINENTLDINGKKITGKNYIISSGSSPFIPPIDGLKHVDYLTNENLFDLNNFPKSVIILGGGAIGIEMAQSLSRLNVEVSVVEMMPNILSREEPEFSKILRKRLEEEGVIFYTSSKAIKVEKANGCVDLYIEKDELTNKISSEKILVAVGRKPNIDINLDNANIKYSRKGIEVNSYLRTSNKKVYAIGDVIGKYQFSHMANFEGINVVKNIKLPFLKKKINYSSVPWTTFTDPEFARIGYTEKEAMEKYNNINIYRYNSDSIDRSKVKYNDIFEVKIITDRNEKVLGAHILGERAGELISEVNFLRMKNISLDKLSSVIHPYPTYSEILIRAGKDSFINKLKSNPIIKMLNKK